MELKVIFYVLLALGWLVSKALTARQKSGSSGAPETEQAPASSRNPGSRELSKELRERRVQRHTPGKVRSDFPERVIRSQRADMAMQPSGFIEEAGYVQIENSPGDTIVPTSASQDSESIADEIRKGQIDWRRQVIISELLTKKYV